jgi:DNA repair protein RadC
MKVNTEVPAEYLVTKRLGAGAEERTIANALKILESRILGSDPLTCPSDVKAYLRLKIASLPYEVFGLILMDNSHRVLSIHELFRGTVDGASVPPREVVREVMTANAAAVILYHNHPSGRLEASPADRSVTVRIADALKLIDVRVLDHLIVTLGGALSFAEDGLL